MEALAFRNAQPRSVNEFQQKSSTDLLERWIFVQFREFFFGKVFLREECNEPFGAFRHGNCFGGILVENLGTHKVFAKTLEGGEVFADAGGGELLLDFQVPDEFFDACFGERFQTRASVIF